MRNELLKRFEQDQRIRRQELDEQVRATEPKKLDEENRKWLAEIIRERGWPGKPLVGADGAHAAWLLVQHADADREFQERCLKQMKKARHGEVAPEDIAYLEDRVRVGKGQPQIYGTQLKTVGGEMKLKEVEDRATLNQRREEVGMMPIEVYLLLVVNTYAPATNDAKELSPGKISRETQSFLEGPPYTVDLCLARSVPNVCRPVDPAKKRRRRYRCPRRRSS